LPTASSVAEEEAWSSLVASQLPDVRRSAENWRNGLVALTGAIAAFSIIKGPEDVGGLDDWAAYTVGVLLLFAFACAIFGAWKALDAAYGTPSIITRERLRSLGGIDGYNLDLAARSAAHLRRARLATIATLILLVAALGLTWYGPRTASVYLHVERKELPGVCGKLLSSEQGYLDLQPPGSDAVRVTLADALKVRAVEECR
jgi:hypothetical protein